MSRLLGLMAGVAFIAAASSPAHAALLGSDLQDWNTAGATMLTLTPVVPGGNQPTNLPCIICGANQPQQPAGLGYNNFGNQGNQTVESYFSTSVVGGSLGLDQFGGVLTGYSILPGSPLLTALGGNTTFSIGIDVNDTGSAQILESFWFLNFTTHTVLAVYSPSPLDGTPLPAPNNGTGFPDYTLAGLSLAGINAGDRIGFFARLTNANDGPDSFFIVPNVAAVPIPAVGTGLPGIVGFVAGVIYWFKRRRQRRDELAFGVA